MQADTQDSGTDNSLLFVAGCLPARYLLAKVALDLPAGPTKDKLRLLAMVPAAVWLSGAVESREKGFLGGEIWWAQNRLWHGLLYTLFAATGEGALLLTDALLASYFGFKHFSKE